jgi:hypothetical protein
MAPPAPSLGRSCAIVMQRDCGMIRLVGRSLLYVQRLGSLWLAGCVECDLFDSGFGLS